MVFENKNVLITGCAGFIGSILAEVLLSEGFRVFLLSINKKLAQKGKNGILYLTMVPKLKVEIPITNARLTLNNIAKTW